MNRAGEGSSSSSAGPAVAAGSGVGQGITLAEVVEAAARVTGRPIPAEHLPPKPEAQILMAESSRIRTELGWQPQNSTLDQILRDGWAATF